MASHAGPQNLGGVMTKKDLDNAKEAYDHAWSEAEKYGNEALEAMKMAESIPARDTSDMFVEKAKRAMRAYENWRKSAQLAAKVMDEYYDQVRPQ